MLQCRQKARAVDRSYCPNWAGIGAHPGFWLWLHGQVVVIVGLCGKQDVPPINESHVTAWDKVALQGLTSSLLYRLASLLGQTGRAVLLCNRRVRDTPDKTTIVLL